MVSLDFSKAFDNVDHSLLCMKLKSQYKLSTHSCNLIKSYLSDREICVRLNGGLSERLRVHSGVVQGSVLGPELFKAYINDLPQVVTNTRVHLFADDVRLYIGSPIGELEHSAQIINADLAEIARWSKRNKLTLNPNKSETMLFSTQTINDRPHILIGQASIPYVPTSKNLGLYFNEDLSWDSHINDICRKVFFSLNKLYNANACFSTELRRKLVIALIIPIMIYGDVMFSATTAFSFHKLERCFNACLRFIYKRRKFDHLSDVRNNLLGCDLTTYYKYRLLTQLFAVIHFKQPSYLYNNISFARSVRTRNMLQPRAKTSYYANSFTFRTAQAWNNLPIQLKSAKSMSEFKRLLKQHLGFTI